jgi:hypothetical protein
MYMSSKMSKLKLSSDWLSDVLSCMKTITLGICGHLCQGTLCEYKKQSHVASMSDLIIVWRGFWETIKRSHWSGKERGDIRPWMEIPSYLPVEKFPYLLLRFDDTYTYYYIPKDPLALCSGSPAHYLQYDSTDDYYLPKRQRRHRICSWKDYILC